MKDFEGELFGLKVKASPYIDENSAYIINTKSMHIVTKMENFEPYGTWHKIKYYFKTLWKALRGKL